MIEMWPMQVTYSPLYTSFCQDAAQTHNNEQHFLLVQSNWRQAVDVFDLSSCLASNFIWITTKITVVLVIVIVIIITIIIIIIIIIVCLQLLVGKQSWICPSGK